VKNYAPYIVGGVLTAVLSLYAYFVLRFAGTSSGNIWSKTPKMFWEEFLFSIPGGLDRKVVALKAKMATADENVYGKDRVWTQKEIREEDLFEECAKDLFVSPVEFWATTIIALIFGFALGWGIVAVL